MWQRGFRSGRAVAGRLAWRSLQVRLAAAAFCLMAAGAGVIGVACHLAAQGYLMRQAGQQLRSYAGVLTSRPFTLFPGSPLAPDAGSPGGPGHSVSIEVRDSGGQLLVSAGNPLPPARGASWLKITEPIRYQERHILFVYGAEDSSFSVTGRDRDRAGGHARGRAGPRAVGQAISRLTLTCLAVSGIALLLLACAAAGVVRGPAAAAHADGGHRSGRRSRRPVSPDAGRTHAR